MHLALLHYDARTRCTQVHIRPQARADELIVLGKPGDSIHVVGPMTAEDSSLLLAEVQSQRRSGSGVLL